MTHTTEKEALIEEIYTEKCNGCGACALENMMLMANALDLGTPQQIDNAEKGM